MAEPTLQDVSTALTKIAQNDLPHIQQRLTAIDVQLGVVQTHLSWQGKLIIILFTASLSLIVGVAVDAFI
jgi:hypothetical protein